jgi:drug/metabolite transporter (DMT)-like permease
VRRRLRELRDRPILTALVGAFCIAFSGIVFRLSHVSPTTGAFFRCLWALPPLALLSLYEDRRYGRRPARARAYACAAGVFFTADLILWHRSIDYVGAGLATVLGNLQVVMVGPIAWAVLRERPQNRALAAMPVSLLGVLLISGVVGSGAYGQDPARGAIYGVLTGVAYSGFLLTLREGSRDVRRTAGPLFDATLVGALGCAATGALIGDLDLTPSWAATGWLVLLALTSQVVGWLLISASLPRLPAALTSVLLTFQPVLSVLFAAALVGESPSGLQLAGVGLVLSGLLVASTTRERPREAAPLLAE